MEKSESASTVRRSFIWLKSKIDLAALIASAIVCAITTPILFISFDKVSLLMLVTKGIQFVALYCIIHAVRCFVARYRADDRLKYAVRSFAVFLSIELIFLILLYPGAWRWDDVNVLNMITQYGNWYTWQHYLTAVFYMVCMFTIPVPAFIVFVQICIISVISAYVVWRLKESTSLSGKALLVASALILLLPPVVNMNLYPLRAALHTYLELLMFFVLIDHYRCKLPWTLPHILRFACLAAVVSVWRSECMIFLVLLPIVFFILGKQNAKRLKTTAVFTLSFFLAFGVLNFYQSVKGAPEYALAAYTPSLTYYAHQAKEDGNEGLVEKLGEVYDVDVLDRAYSEGATGEVVFWERESNWPFLKIRSDLSRGEFYAQCRNAFVAATLEYPNLLLESRFRMMANGMSGCYWTTPHRAADAYAAFPSFSSRYFLNAPLSENLRTQVSSFIEGIGPAYGWVMNFYNLFLLVPCYLALYVYLIVKRSRLVFALLAFNAHQVVTILMAPAYYFMYYYSFYLGGIIIIAGFGLLLGSKVRPKNSGEARQNAR